MFFFTPLIPCGSSMRLAYRKSVCGNLPIASKQVVLAIMSGCVNPSSNLKKIQ
ncbi:hypothetical protein LINPERHAP1_LOCUS26351, partial [Linum perenne]